MSAFKVLLMLHVICGGISLLMGGYIVMTRKGGRRHKTAGNIYFVSMLVAALAALVLSCLHPNYFLFIVGVFTAFMLLSGRRYINKKPGSDVKMVDWMLSGMMLLFALAFVGFGSYKIYMGESFGTVFLAFGGIALLFVYQDYSNFTGKSRIANYWLTTHLQRMMGSYVASLTAFLVVNNTLLPAAAAWLLPTVVMVPLIVFWTRKNKVVNNS
jgi:uncharacterized membrane protein